MQKLHECYSYERKIFTVGKIKYILKNHKSVPILIDTKAIIQCTIGCILAANNACFHCAHTYFFLNTISS